ncbi:hypothetical protein SASPL_129893 [Salvia splendens]|uniref:DUF3741 domain-containing protein n=1 Tax=Salvia splendens TaxID=180675 RepID=A0A8X8ZPV6_SALSN|nr:uncharacterized protein LOC121753335 [Salvia splendens]KAG6411809.1 hypothetical protein SASPL_129893 [Salvia splendens]
MLMRQESSLSASRRQAACTTPETQHAKAIGCMSGIIHLFSKYQKSNRRLTFGKNQEKKKAATNSVVRSPTLPPEIRRVENCSSVVARLMGVEDSKRIEDSVGEKRQRLMDALEKCNEDLEELKRIIKAVQAANGGIKMCTDELICSPLTTHITTGEVQVPQHRKPTATKKPGEDEEAIAIARLVTKSTIIESSLEMRRRAAAAAASSPPWSSRAMVESVEEVCNDIGWGEKREIGRIGLVLQDHVCRELIEELVKDLKSSSIIPPLPLEACKRKLCFS